MPHQLLTAFSDPHHALFTVSCIAADRGIAADRAPVVLNAALVGFDGLPEHELYLTRRAGVWHPIPAGEVARVLESGALVIAC